MTKTQRGFICSVGQRKPGSRIFFRSAKDHETRLDVFADPDLNHVMTQPIIADADGCFPPVWLAETDFDVGYFD